MAFYKRVLKAEYCHIHIKCMKIMGKNIHKFKRKHFFYDTEWSYLETAFLASSNK